MALTTKQKRLQQENQRYWDRREREALQHQRLRSKAETYDTHIRRTLEHTLEQAQKEIDAFFRKYASTEGISIEEAKRRASNFDIEAFASKAKEYVETKNFSDEANEALRLYNLTMRVNRLELLKAQIGLDMVDDFNELQKYFDKELTEDTLAELRRQAGILGETVIDPAGKASEIVNGTWYNARLSERIWLQQDLLRFQLEGLLTDGILQGKNPRVLARELRKKFDTTIYNTERLMRTELARVQIGAQLAEYEENDVEEYEFIANSTACPICRDLDGKHFKVKDLVIAKNAPPMHPNCMCSTAPYQDEAEWDAKQNFISNGGSSKEWDKLSQAERDKLIAQARENNKKIEAEVLKAYRENSKINGEEQFRELTLEEFRKLSPTISKEERDIIYGPNFPHDKYHGYVGSIFASRRINGPLHEGFTLEPEYQKIYDTLKSVIERNSIPENILVTRYTGMDALEGMFGVKLSASLKDTPDEAFNKWQNALQQGVDRRYTEIAFLSTSGVPDRNIMTDKPVCMNIRVKQGTPGYITNNNKESEIIFGPGTKVRLIGARVDRSQSPWKVILDCELE